VTGRFSHEGTFTERVGRVGDHLHRPLGGFGSAWIDPEEVVSEVWKVEVRRAGLWLSTKPEPRAERLNCLAEVDLTDP
jgi:hypothetical protein